jgi:NAD(P)-dependent dehydrogenase (short-subunit alcohol dehydrogenase family)
MAHIVITGCNRGIGLELVRQYTARGDTVTAACRHAGPELEATGARIIDGIDVATDEGVAHLAEALGDTPIDVLVNNAGILRSDTFDTLDFDAMLEQYKVNTLGPLRVTRALSDKLSAGSKIAIVSSRVGSIEDNGSGNNYGYRASKTAVNQVGMNLKHDFEDRGVAVALLHPGLVATDMTGGTGIAPADAARGLIDRIDELTLETSGGFWHAEGYRLPW